MGRAQAWHVQGGLCRGRYMAILHNSTRNTRAFTFDCIGCDRAGAVAGRRGKPYVKTGVSGLDYRKGFLHGLPIALGYVSVSFAFGIQASAAGLYPWQALLVSLLNVTSAGQVAGLQLMGMGAGLAEMALTQLTINLRSALMSLALGQKLDDSMTLGHRLAISFCNTDEVFFIAASQPGKLGKAYLYGLTNGPYLGWALGTFLGAVAGDLLPASVTGALGIAIYGMFLAIVLPPFRHSHEIRVVVLVSVGLSCLLTYVPAFHFVTGGFRIIVCAVVSSALAAWLVPVAAAPQAQSDDIPCEDAQKEALH